MERVSSLEGFQEGKWAKSGVKQIAFGDPNNEWLTDDCFFTYTGFQGEQYQSRRDFFTSVIQLAITSKSLTGRIIEPLAEGCKELKILDLSKSSIDVVGKLPKGKKEYDAVTFPELVQFRMNNAEKLEKILLIAPKLTRLEANNCPKLSELSVDAPNLETVFLKNAKAMDNSSLKKLIDQSSELKALTILGLEGCEKIKKRDILELAPYYPVDLLKNVDERVKSVVKGILMKKVTEVFLDDILLTLKEVKALSKALSIFPSVEKLSFKYDSLGEKVMELIDAFLKCTSLQSLDLEWNEIEGSHVEKLVNVLPNPNSLRVLTLTENKIGQNGIEKLAEVLRKCSSLQTLRLASNEIDSDGIKVLTEILPQCTSLQTLDLAHNELLPKWGESPRPTRLQNRT